MPSARRSFKSDGPAALSAISAWLRLGAQASVITAGKYSTIAEVLGGHNIVQATAGRRPTAAISTNGLPILTWNGANVLPWTVTTANNATAAWGFAMWVKPTANVTSRQRFAFTGFPGASNKIAFDINSGGGLSNNWYQDGSNGRQQTVAANLAPSAWQFLRLQFDGSASTDSGKMKIFVGEVDQSSTYGDIAGGGAMAALNACVGDWAIGAQSDVDSPSTALLNGFQTGPNMYTMSAALTLAEGQALMGFDAPT